ncbi:MAG TPA: HD domain-containing protein [Candidatus Paceibacterota bacterium]
MSNSTFEIPPEVSRITKKLEENGFEAYLIGGCVRDLFLGKKPKDWDITTNAKPDDIVSLFENTFYENEFGTVGVVNETDDQTLKVIEVTPYRTEGKYTDRRRPDNVSFDATLEDDLKRRDFTINAIALNSEKNIVVDPFLGRKDIQDGLIRTVGNPNDRFEEDGLRLIRAIRIYSELGFYVEKETLNAIEGTSYLLKNIAKERIRDEFIKIIESPNPMNGLILAQKTGVLKYIIPELQDAVGIEQNKAHAYDVWTHLQKTLQHSADKKLPLHVRLAALFHDISKPAARRRSENGEDWTFYGHDVLGAKITEKILEDLKFPRDTINKVAKLVRWHMFFSDTEKITLSAVRRLVANVGEQNVWDLMDLRACDRVGTGRPKEHPYRLRKYKAMVEEVMRDPVTVGMLKINGDKIMKITSLPAGPKIGFILHALLEEVLEKPDLNTEEELIKITKKLGLLSDDELKKIGEAGKRKREEEEEKVIKEIRGKYWVK